jgi:hypothetical protein
VNACPTCGQPATRAFPPHEGWECRNEACPEFGQPLTDHEPAADGPPSPRGPETLEEREAPPG